MSDGGLQQRTKQFTLDVIRFVQALPNQKVYWVIGDQLLRSGTSVGANTRAAHRGRSKREYAAKIGIVLEEADESLFWLEILEEGGLCPQELEADLQKLKQEAGELTAIFATIHRKFRP
jgi:four helix bundle protein